MPGRRQAFRRDRQVEAGQDKGDGGGGQPANGAPGLGHIDIMPVHSPAGQSQQTRTHHNGENDGPGESAQPERNVGAGEKEKQGDQDRHHQDAGITHYGHGMDLGSTDRCRG